MQYKTITVSGKLHCAIVLILLGSSVTLAQAKPKTVTEFYMALPTSFNIVKNLDATPFRDGFFFGEFYENATTTSSDAMIKHRKSLIQIEDIANGYLKLQPIESEGWAEVALFKKTDGNYLVAISQVECGPSCSGDLMILSYDRGTWTNVTKQVFVASPSSNEGYFKLPRTGTTIQLTCGDESSESRKSGKSLAAFEWNKETFNKKASR